MPTLRRRLATVDEGFAYFESFTNLEKSTNQPIRNYRLDRMRALLDLFDHPENSFRSVHLAGSKGKGSTAIFIASVLREAGITCGLYASPHVSNYRERITLAGEFFAERDYLEGMNLIAERLHSIDESVLPVRGEPTTFELLTLLAFLMFRKSSCGWAVVETGIGGRLDATNVILPVACALTPVEKEHTEILGTTLPQIASEKAGIIKERVPVFVGLQDESVREVFAATAALKNAPIRFLADEAASIRARLGFDGTEERVEWKRGGADELHLSMPGEVQAENAALALLTVRGLLARRTELALPEIPEWQIKTGLGRARLPGRMEMIPPGSSAFGAHGWIVLDAAHTPVSVRRLRDSFRSLFSGASILIFGSVAGKNPEEMAEEIARSFQEIIISTPGSFKKSDPGQVSEIFRRIAPLTRLVLDPKQALGEAIRLSHSSGGPHPILVTGSFYMVAEIRKLLL